MNKTSARIPDEIPFPEQLLSLIGVETPIDEVSRRLCYFAQELHPAVVGALQLTCSDESELECAQSFKNGFVNHVLPTLKFAHQSPFRIANPGARYEWGCMPLAEDHFTTKSSRSDCKLMVAKLNSHVSVESGPDGLKFGKRVRYEGTQSVYCGALHALAKSSHLPFLQDLRESLTSDGVDRIALLKDKNSVDPELRPLFAAIVSARVQARHAVMDVQDHTPKSPTIWLVLPCVTLNKPDRDTEIPCGLYLADQRGTETSVVYRGLGDDPTLYDAHVEHDRLHVRDEHVRVARDARNHRRLVLDTWEVRKQLLEIDERVQTALQKARRKALAEPSMVKPALKALMPLLMELSPVPTAIALFAHGATGIHHVHRVRRLTQDVTEKEEARRVLEDVARLVQVLPPDEAHAVLELLHRTH